MDENQGTMQMTVSSKEALLLGALAHTHVLQEDAGAGVRHGIVLYVEDAGKTNKVLEDLRRYGILEQSLFGKEKSEFPNYRMAVAPFSRSCAMEKIHGFLECRGFIPAVIVGGVLPDYFYERNLLLLSLEGKVQEKEEDSLNFGKFKQFVHQTPEFICQCISAFLTSVRFKNIKKESDIRVSLEITAYILANVYRQWHDEEETMEFQYGLVYHVEKMCQAGFGVYDGMNVSLAVSNCLSGYLDMHCEVNFYQPEKGGEDCKPVEEGTGILYDSEFYYLTDRLLRLACKPLLDSMSYLAIKATLHQEGTLVCNQADGSGYTVKRLFCDQAGKMARIRVIKLRRAALDSNGGLTLVERRQLHVSREMRGQRLQGGEGSTKRKHFHQRNLRVRKDLQDEQNGTGQGEGKA